MPKAWNPEIPRFKIKKKKIKRKEKETKAEKNKGVEHNYHANSFSYQTINFAGVGAPPSFETFTIH